MEEKSRSYGCFLAWEQEKNIEKYLREMEENGTEKRALEYAHKFLSESSELENKLEPPYKPLD
ncbi:hypothetical protein GW932_01875 [archaeon]|nr:hypothetical protein [archaeon]